jgi:hypothetical protein
MIKNGLQFLIFAWIILLMSTCAIDSDIPKSDYPKKYVFDSYCKGALKAHTISGVITDTLMINDFIAEKKDFFWHSTFKFGDCQMEIEVINDTTAKITDGDTIYCDLIRKNGIVYFQSKNGIMYFNGHLLDERFKYSPLYIREYPFTIGGGYGIIPCYYFIESNGELHLPYVSYLEKIYSSTGDLSYDARGNYQNVFNTSYLSKVQNSGSLIDTIVYQDNNVIFKEK